MIRVLIPFFILLSACSVAQTPPSPPEMLPKSDEVSLDLKIGQMLMVGFPDIKITADDALINEIASGKVGGVLLFEKNIDDKDSYVRLKRMVSAMKQATEDPIFMAIDQEGGLVNRLKEKYGFPRSVTAEYLGQLNNLDSTTFYSEMTAATLAGLGFNVNFAPVLDLASNPNNPVIAKHGRAYSADPDVVTSHAGAVMEAHKKFNIVTVGKHFPGHGSSQADSHIGMADVTKTWKANELQPYKNLIEKGHLESVMSAHIVNAQLDDSKLPGTLSKVILQGILREELGFNGVVFSDDMQMQAITKHYGLEKAIKLGINAGLDVLVFSNNIHGSKERTVNQVHTIIKELIEKGEILESRIDESYQRIIKLKSTL